MYENTVLEIDVNGKGRVNRCKSGSRLIWFYLHYNIDLDPHDYGIPTQKYKDSGLKTACRTYQAQRKKLFNAHVLYLLNVEHSPLVALVQNVN